ncbi:MAG: hypothetical protein V1748_06475 [Actinomycetota bacterium]
MQLAWLLITVVVVVLAVGGYMVVTRVFAKRTYVSKTSGLEFSHPFMWSRMSPVEFAQKMGDARWAELMNETVVVNSTTRPTQAITASSMPGLDPALWDAIKAELLASLNDLLVTPDPGIGVPAPLEYYDYTTPGSSMGIEGKFELAIAGESAKMRFVFIMHGSTAYLIIYLNSNTNANVDAEWQKIRDSVAFTR